MELVNDYEIRKKDELLDVNEDIVYRALRCVKVGRVRF